MPNRILKLIEDDAAIVDAALKKYMSEKDSDYLKLFDAVEYSLFTGGKRIRPVLTLEFSRALGGSIEAAVPYACAIEMIHTYSLIHDDMPCMDNDDYRRGKLTNHKVFGEATALIAGDALLTKAFGVAAENANASDRQNIKAVEVLSRYAGMFGMIGGQQLDMEYETENASFDRLIKMNSLKTACLIKAGCLLGCIAAGRTDEGTFNAAAAYAEGVGIAFQARDDLLDKGEDDEKTTFLTFLNESETEELIKKNTFEAISAVCGFDLNQNLSGIAEFLAYRDR